MAERQNMLQKMALLSLGALGVLFVLAIAFYKERLFFADASYISFNILNHKSLFIQEHRLGSFITQLVPYLGCKLHLSIALILCSYSVCFNLFYLAVGYIVYRCRQYALVIIMTFYYYLLVSDTFFWPTNEIHQAVAWMFLLLAVSIRLKEKNTSNFVFIPLFLVLAVFTLFTHFIVFIPLLFLWVFLWVDKNSRPWSHLQFSILSLAILLIVAAKFIFVKNNSYDQLHLQYITHPSLTRIFKCITSPVIKKFVWRTFSNYWLWVIVFGAGIISMVREKNWIPVAWCLVSFVGYVLLMGITYGDFNGDILLFHIESEWQCLAVIVVTPFVYSFLPRVQPRMGVLMLVCIFLVRIVYICNSSTQFSWRVNFEQNVLAQMRKTGITKLRIVGDKALEQKCMLTWAIPEESMLMSAVNGDNPLLTFVVANYSDSSLITQSANPKLIVLPYEQAGQMNWNYDYFKPDTLHPYTILTYKQLMQ